MALTDHERHQLELLAEQLMQQDPRLAAKLSAGADGTGEATQPARRAAGGLTMFVGLFAFMAGIATQVTGLGFLGFAIMATGAYFVFEHTRLRISFRHATAPDPDGGGAPASG